MIKISVSVGTFNLDRLRTDIPCPRCRLETNVKLGEIRRRDYIVCRGCYWNIHLVDHMSSVHRAQKKINKMLKNLEF